MNEVNFSNPKYKQKALNLTKTGNTHSPADAFLALIKIDKNRNLTPNDLENLCKKIQNHYKSQQPSVNLTVEACYRLTQSDNLDDVTKTIILNSAYECLKEGKHLGNNTILEGKINTSSWISHSIFMSEVCAFLAHTFDLDINVAKTLGLLHDFGRKYNHTFNHVVIGFEKLCDLGWDEEALSCLTHSFVNGGRCSNNEQAVDGFYINNEGNPEWVEGTKKDDITLFLESYNYDGYDIILNIGDLMATDKGIVAPHERIADIKTRRIIDPTNRSYFLADLTNLLINFLNKSNCNTNNFQPIKAKKGISLEQIENYFNIVSQSFFNIYLRLQQKNTTKQKQ